MVIQIQLFFIKQRTVLTLENIFRFNSMYVCFVSLQREGIANFFPTFVTNNSCMNKFSVIFQFHQSSITSGTLVTFVWCPFLVFDYNMFTITCLCPEHLFTVWTWPIIFLFWFLLYWEKNQTDSLMHNSTTR